MDFQGIIKLKSNQSIKKITFICPQETFAYRKMSFGLNNVKDTFPCAIPYAFHENKKIVKAYIYDLTSISRKRVEHPKHLKFVFDRCRYYKIRLDHETCMLYVILGWLLSFIISKHGIFVDPIKVYTIVQLPPPRNLHHCKALNGNQFCYIVSLPFILRS